MHALVRPRVVYSTACVGAHLVGTGDDGGKLPLLLPLSLHHRLQDAGMVGSEIDEAMCDTGLGDVMVNWYVCVTNFETRPTSHIASKNAKDAVYLHLVSPQLLRGI